jgi:hypothetical protein
LPGAPRKKIFISLDALESARQLAPGWYKHVLEAKFLEWVEGLHEPLRLPPERAFLGWVKSFTKGNRA